MCIHDDARQEREHLEAKRVLGKVESELDALAAPSRARDPDAHHVVLVALVRTGFAVFAVLDEECLGRLAVVLPSTGRIIILTVVAVLAVLAGFNVIPSCSSRTEQVGTR